MGVGRDPQSALRRGAIALALALAASIAFTMWIERWSPVSQPVTPPMIVQGEGVVGAPFRLTDQFGRTVATEDFRGRTLVIYFGWRLDPDLTPAALQVLAAALAQLGPKSNSFAPVFITLDPGRDDPAKLKLFLNEVGLSGTALIGDADETAALARAFKLYWKRLSDPALPDGYSIDHASLYYVMGKDGAFRGVVPYATDAAALASELVRLSN